MGYDVGDVWMIKNVVNGKESEQKFTGPIVAGYGKGHAVQVSFVGTNVSVKIDDKEYYNADVLDDSLSGKLGLRTWGYSGNYASISLSELHYNEVKAPEKDPDGNYMTSFTDPDCRGGWSKAWSQNASNEGLSFVDGEGDAGYMRAFAGPEGVANGNTFLIDSMSPSIENGFVEFDVTNQSAGRIGFLFRVQDLTSANKKYVAMQYDLGEDWNLVINGGDPITIKEIPALNKGEKHHIRIEYVGENIRMLMDGKEVLVQNFKGANIGEGKIGLRVWGWGTGDNQGNSGNSGNAGNSGNQGSTGNSGNAGNQGNAGNTGNQTLTLLVRSLAMGQVTSSNRSDLFKKELCVAIINGVIWGLIAGGFAWLLYADSDMGMKLGLVMFLAMMPNIIVGALVGLIVPLTLKRLGRDPAMGSSVLLTFITDSGGFLIFLGLATAFFA